MRQARSPPISTSTMYLWLHRPKIGVYTQKVFSHLKPTTDETSCLHAALGAPQRPSGPAAKTAALCRAAELL